jgi:hypothetical protein
MTLEYEYYSDLTNHLEVRKHENVLCYRHSYSEQKFEWRHIMSVLIPMTGGSAKTLDWSDDKMHNFTLTGTFRCDYQYHTNFQQDVCEYREAYITQYRHYFCEKRNCGIHQFTKHDGTVFEECEESIGTLIIYTED